MRLFFAVEFDGAVRQSLGRLEVGLREHGWTGSFTPAGNFHLTLEFLGEVGQQTLARVDSAAREVRFGPFGLELAGLGTFRGGILWLGIKPCPPLTALQGALRQKLLRAGLQLEQRPYSPHITLAREAQGMGAVPFAELERELLPEAITVDVREFVLMRSDRAPGGVRYTAVKRYSPFPASAGPQSPKG